MNSIHQNSSIQRVASPDGRGYCGLRQYRYDRPRTPATEKRTNKLLIKNPPKVSGGSGTLKLLNFVYEKILVPLCVLDMPGPKRAGREFGNALWHR